MSRTEEIIRWVILNVAGYNLKNIKQEGAGWILIDTTYF